MVIMASMKPQVGQTAYAWSAFLHLIQFLSFKEGLDHIVQNQHGSDLDGLVSFWPYRSGLEASWCARITGPSSGRMQLACYQFPIVRFNCILPQMVLTYCPKPAWIWFGSGRVRFGPNGSGPEASWCTRIIGPASGQCFWAVWGRERQQSGYLGQHCNPSSGSGPGCLVFGSGSGILSLFVSDNRSPMTVLVRKTVASTLVVLVRLTALRLNELRLSP